MPISPSGRRSCAVAAVEADLHGGMAERRTTGGHDHAELDTMGHSTHAHSSDPEGPFGETVRWVDQELPLHGAGIALVHDLFRVRRR